MVFYVQEGVDLLYPCSYKTPEMLVILAQKMVTCKSKSIIGICTFDIHVFINTTQIKVIIYSGESSVDFKNPPPNYMLSQIKL